MTDTFTPWLKSHGLPEPVQEHRFHPTRRWRFDYAWPHIKVALEIEGGAWTNGRHNRATGFLADMEKYNAATVLGWQLLRVTPSKLYTPYMLELLRQVLA